MSNDSPDNDLRPAQEMTASFERSDADIQPGSGPSEARASPAEGGGSVIAGVLLAFALQVCQLLVFAVYPLGALFLGVTQLPYIVPAVLIPWSKARPRLGMGVIIGAAILFLLNATCWGLSSRWGPFSLFQKRSFE